MKKLITLAFAMLFALGLPGCAESPQMGAAEADSVKWALIPMIRVDGVLYLDTGIDETDGGRCGTFDGEISSSVAANEIPTADDQSNFGTGYGYQYKLHKNEMVVHMNGGWRIFAEEGTGRKRDFPEGEISDAATSCAGWTADQQIYAGALNSDKLAISSVQHLPIYRFDTLEELEQFKLNFGEVLTMDSGCDEIPSLNEVTAGYDKAFFRKNSLMLVYVSAASGSYRFGINSVFCDGEVFCIHVERLNDPEAVTEDMAGWFITAAVSDKSIKDCTEFDADLNNFFDT